MKRVTKKRTEHLMTLLDENYPAEIECYLHYATPWQLLISTIMSAQCTDRRVNIVADTLYKKYPSVEAFAAADLNELEEDIRSTGFYHNKAKNIIACCQTLLTRFGGEVPSSIEELTSLAGVGRKTANVVRSHIFHIDSIVVDTHVKRISKKLGLTENDDPEKIEYDLMKLLPKEHWIRYNLQIIAHGRSVCISGRPRCEECCLRSECASCE